MNNMFSGVSAEQLIARIQKASEEELQQLAMAMGAVGSPEDLGIAAARPEGGTEAAPPQPTPQPAARPAPTVVAQPTAGGAGGVDYGQLIGALQNQATPQQGISPVRGMTTSVGNAALAPAQIFLPMLQQQRPLTLGQLIGG